MLYSTATSVGYVFPLLIGTLMVTTEFRHKTLTPTFLATPSAGVVLWAKLVVGVVLGVLFGVLGVVAPSGPAAGFLAGYGLDTDLTSADTWALLGRMVLAFVLWVLVGIGVGALVRNQVGAIVGVLVFTQFLEPIGRAAAAFVDGLSDVDPVPAGRGERRARRARASSPPRRRAARAGDGLEWWVGGLVLLGYAGRVPRARARLQLAPRRDLNSPCRAGSDGRAGSEGDRLRPRWRASACGRAPSSRGQVRDGDRPGRDVDDVLRLAGHFDAAAPARARGRGAS